MGIGGLLIKLKKSEGNLGLEGLTHNGVNRIILLPIKTPDLLRSTLSLKVKTNANRPHENALDFGPREVYRTPA